MINSNRWHYEKLTRLIVRELRKTHTQKHMSSLLGFKFNQWHKWESGQKTLMWMDFQKIARILKIDLGLAVQTITNSEEKIPNGGIFVKKVIQKYGGGLSNLQTQKKLEISKPALNRIITSKKDVEVAFVFQCLGELSSTLPYLMGCLVENFKDSSIRNAIERSTSQVAIEGTYPWISAIEAFLETDEYQRLEYHSDKEVANYLGISISEAKYGIKLLLENKAIVKEDSKFRLNVKSVDLDTNITDSAKFAKFWTHISLKRYLTKDGVPQSKKGWASRVFPVSEEADKEIRDLTLKLANDIAGILHADQSRVKNKVRIFILHYFDHQEFKRIKITAKNS